MSCSPSFKAQKPQTAGTRGETWPQEHRARPVPFPPLHVQLIHQHGCVLLHQQDFTTPLSRPDQPKGCDFPTASVMTFLKRSHYEQIG